MLSTMFGVEYAMMLTYRAEIVLWAVATCLPLIMLGVWSEAFGSGRFEGLSAAWAARYFIAVFLVRQLSVVWVMHYFEYQVVSGRLSGQLLLPVDPVWRYLTMHLAEQVCRLPIVGLMIGLCLWLFPEAWRGGGSGDGGAGGLGAWRVSAASVGLGLLATGMAFVSRFFLQYALAMLAFRMERVMALHELIWLPILFLSGMVAPLEVFPEGVRAAVLWTPLPWLVWFPAKLFMGDYDAPLVLRGFAMLVGWGVVFVGVQRWAWRVGLRNYSAMGA